MFKNTEIKVNKDLNLTLKFFSQLASIDKSVQFSVLKWQFKDNFLTLLFSSSIGDLSLDIGEVRKEDSVVLTDLKTILHVFNDLREGSITFKARSILIEFENREFYALPNLDEALSLNRPAITCEELESEVLDSEVIQTIQKCISNFMGHQRNIKVSMSRKGIYSMTDTYDYVAIHWNEDTLYKNWNLSLSQKQIIILHKISSYVNKLTLFKENSNLIILIGDIRIRMLSVFESFDNLEGIEKMINLTSLPLFKIIAGNMINGLTKISSISYKHNEHIKILITKEEITLETYSPIHGTARIDLKANVLYCPKHLELKLKLLIEILRRIDRESEIYFSYVSDKGLLKINSGNLTYFLSVGQEI